jgi:hypothetical protein
MFTSDVQKKIGTSTHGSLAEDHLLGSPDFNHWHAPNGTAFKLLNRHDTT